MIHDGPGKVFTPVPRPLKKSNGFPLLFFASLQFGKSAVPSVNIVIVLIASRLSLPFRNNARYTVYKYVLQHILSGVQTRFLLAGETRFEHATYGFGDRYSTVEPLP